MGRVKSLDRESWRKDAHGGKAKFRYKGKLLKQHKNKYGYLTVPLGRSHACMTVHRLVGLAFLPNPDNKPQINHKDGDKTNNKLENLEWATSQENQLHSIHVLGNRTWIKQNKPVKCIETGEVFENATIAANGDICVANRIRMVANHCYGRKTCLGKHWEFVHQV